MSTNRKPATVFPVRDYILDELDERGMSAKDLRDGLPYGEMRLAFDLVMNPTKGVYLGVDMADELARFFGTGREYWVNLDNAWQRKEGV